MADTDLTITVRAEDQVSPSLKRIESSIIRFVGAISAALASIRVVTLPVQQAAEFQKQLLDVAKTTEFTDTQINVLSASLIELSKRLNVSATDLAKIAEIGGQLGVGAEGPQALAAFTETASRFSSVLEVTAEEAGNAIAKIANIFGIGIRDAERISSTLNELANRSTASGRDLIDIIQRIGTAGATVNFQQAAALAATGRDLGLTLETIGTSFNKIFLDLQTKAPDVAQLIGRPVEEFTALLRTDGIAALELYLNALSKLPGQQRAALAEQITGGGRIFALVTSLIKQQEDANNGLNDGVTVLRRNLSAAEEGFSTGTSAIREQQRVLQGLLAQVQILKNVFFALGEAIGRRALPYLTDLVKRLQQLGQDKEFIRRLNEFADTLGRLIVSLLSFVEALLRSENAIGLLLRGVAAFLAIKVGSTLFSIGTAAVTSATKLYDLAKAFTAVASGAQQVQTATGKGKGGAGGGTQLSPATAKFASALSSIFGPGNRNKREIGDAYDEINRRNVELLAAERQIVAVRKQAADEIRAERALSRQRSQAAQAAGNRRSATAITAASALSVQATLTSARAAETQLLAVRNAAQAVITTQQGIISHNQQIANSLRPIPTAVGLIAAGFGAVTKAVVGIGGRILAALTGPIGLGIALVTTLLDAFGLLDPILKGIGVLLGINSDKEREAAQATRDRLAFMEQSRAAAAATSEEYDAFVAKNKTLLSDTKDRAKAEQDYGQAWAANAKAIELAAGKLQDLRFRQVEQSNILRAIKDRAAQLTDELSKAKAELVSIEERNRANRAAAGRTSVVSRLNVDTKAEDEARNRVKLLEAEYASLGLAAENVAKQQVAAQKEVVKVTDEQIAATSNLLAIYNKEGESVATALRNQLNAQKQVATLQERIGDLRRRGAGTTDASDELNIALARTEQEFVNAQVAADQFKGAVAEALGRATPAAIAFYKALAPQGNLTKLEDLEQRLNAIASARGEQTKQQIDDQQKVTQGIKETEDALKKATRTQSVFGKGLSDFGKTLKGIGTATGGGLGVVLGSNLESFGASTDKAQEVEKKRLERQLAGYRAIQDQIDANARVAIAAQERVGNAAQGQLTDTASYFQRLISAVALEGLLAQQVKAQEQVSASAIKNAELAKTAYKNAQDDIVKTLQENSRRLVEFYGRENDRLVQQQLARQRLLRDRQLKVADRATGRAFDRERDRIQKAGLGKEATQAQLDALADQEELIRANRQAEADRKDAIDQVSLAYQRQKEIQAQIAFASKDIAALDEQRKRATDVESQKRLSAEIAVQVALVDQLTKDYESQAKTVEELGRKQFPTLSNLETPPLVSKEEIQQQFTTLNKLRVDAARLKEEAARTEAESAQKVSTAEATKLTDLNAQLKRTTQEVVLAGQQLGDAGLATAVRQLGTAIASSVPGAQELQRALSDIADIGINTDKFSAQVADLNTQITQVTATISAKTQELVRDAVAGGAATTKELISSISQQVLANPLSLSFLPDEKSKQQFADSLNTLVLTPQVGGVSDAITRELEAADFKVDVEVTLVPAPGQPEGLGQLIPKKAEGGYISLTPQVKAAEGGYLRGPGTSKSDSILAALSNGEYVMDARTTRLFGPHFFTALQSIANRGRSAVARVLTPRIPHFAVGGPVLSSSLAGAGDIGSGETIKVDLNVAGKTFTVAAERRQAQEFARTLKNLQRGL